MHHGQAGCGARFLHIGGREQEEAKMLRLILLVMIGSALLRRPRWYGGWGRRWGGWYGRPPMRGFRGPWGLWFF